MKLNSIENELVILTKQTLDIFLKSENPSDVIALYTFYYYTAKWQETNQPKCTTNYVATGLKWSETRVRKAKKELVLLGLIEDVKIKDKSGKINGHFIKLNYVIKQSTLKDIHTIENPQSGEINSMENVETNALSSNNLNALSSDIKSIVEYLNEKVGTNYRSSGANTKRHINARLSEGFTVEDFKTVIDKKCDDWIGTEWEKYLCPTTLFGTKFENYLNANVTRKKFGKTGVEIKNANEDDLDGIL